MAKSIVKELIIVLLLCLAIIIILGILLYEYIPMAKTIPNEVSYTTPTEAKEELAKSDEVDESKIIMTYEVNSADLNNYKKIQKYKPGKANPFSSFETSGTGTSENGNGSTGTNNNGNQNNNNSSSGGKFFPDKGTK